MSKLIAIVGNTGAGKTSLVRALCQHNNFATGLEQHADRPFQVLFKNDPHYALANQVDYLLLRAKQEYDIRQSALDGLIDGGLDLDFHGFTRLFHARGYLTESEFNLCKELYTFCRSALPLPNLIVHLTIDLELSAKRLAERDRVNIATPQDLSKLDELLLEWLDTLEPERVVHIDVSDEDIQFSRAIPYLLNRIMDLTT